MSIWDKFPDYSAEELRTLTAVAAETLVDCAQDASLTADVLRLSSKAVTTELQSMLQDSIPGVQGEQLQAAFDDPERAQKIALAVLWQVRHITPLAEVVAEAYEARNREMAGPELLLLTGAIVILALKVKSVDISKSGAKFSFYEAGAAVKSFVTDFVKSGVRGG